MPRRRRTAKQVETITHKEATRMNIPTVEHEPSLRDADKSPIRVSYERRNKDLDPQLVWSGKDEQDWSNLVVQAPPLYIQEKIHPKAIIDLDVYKFGGKKTLYTLNMLYINRLQL